MGLFASALSDGDRLEVAGAPVRLKVHRGARRVSLRVDRAKREIVATAPSARRLAEAVAFARDRAEWIAERLGELPAPTPVSPGMTVEVFGEPWLLVAGQGRARLEPGPPVRLVCGEREFSRAVLRAIKRVALERLAELTAAHCATLGVARPKVALADAGGRWGSCKPAHAAQPAMIRYSWRLALAPLAVADYVAAHECAHLLELNHGPKFWAVSRRLVGDERPHRAWLRAHGARLHAFGR